MRQTFARFGLDKMLVGLAAFAAAYIFLHSLPSPTSVTLENDAVKFASGEDINFDMRINTLVALTLLMGALTLALKRRDKIIKLQNQILANQENELIFSSQAINSHAIVSETDASGDIIQVNEKFIDVFEFEAEELIGQSTAKIYEDGKFDPQFQEISKAMKAGEVWVGEQRLRSKSGRLIIAQCTVMPMYDAAGNHIKNISLRTDYTAARRSEAERYLTVLLKNLQDEVYIYDAADLSISYMNDCALERVGWSPEEAVSKKISDTARQFDTRRFRSHVRPLLEGERSAVYIEIELDGEFFEVGTRLFTGPDEIPVFVSVSRDITKRKTEELMKLATVSTVSHELRAPLTSIQGSLKLLKSGKVGELNPKASSMVEIASRNSEKMLLVVNDILDLEKIRSGGMRFNMTSIDLSDLVADAVETNRAYCDQHDVGIVIDVPSGNWSAIADPDRLSQVITNLITNAAKFSRAGSCIDVGLSVSDESYRVSIKDHGPGIPESDISMVFESFSQLQPSDGKKREGTGLGLAISKEIIRAHSGVIDCKSELGVGCEFYFELPRRIGQELADQRSRSQVSIQ